MQCESCQTEFTGEICPSCGLKIQKVMCKDCYKKFYKSYLQDGLCPICYDKEINAPYKSPLTATLLSIVPGLGHYYLGLKDKGGLYLLMFCLSCVIPIIGWLMLPIAYFLPMFDAYKTANRINNR